MNAVRMFLPVCAACILGQYALNRDTTLLDHGDPISKPVSKRCVFLDFGCHGLSRANIHTTGLLGAVELGVLTGRTQKELNC